MHPLLSVILPVYNGLPYLHEAIESVLKQTFSDFELIIIDDGSTDNSAQLIENITDPRIRFLRQSNQGLAATLNRAISLSSGKYIARQDQDDICYPARFEKQLNFLEANPNVAIVGSSARILVGNETSNRSLVHPTEDAVIKFGMLFDNHFVHSSVMIRRAVLDKVGGYAEDKSRQPPEDYELWSRVMKEYKVGNLPEVLMVYREVAGSMSRTGASPFLRKLITISAENLAWASGKTVAAKEIVALSCLLHGDYRSVPGNVSFAEMKTVLRLAANKIADDAAVPVADLDFYLRRQIKKLLFHFVDYRCYGVPGKIVSSKGFKLVRNFRKKLIGT
jgi:glycosyltransferase involved in cell wall biosynthesis